jgi:hypothetical protein
MLRCTLDVGVGSKPAAEPRARQRRVLPSERTPKARLSEEFHVDPQKRPRRKPAGALFRGDRYVGTPLFRFPFVGEVEAVASIARRRGRWSGCIWSARELPATIRDRPEQRPLGFVAQAAVIEIGGRILHALFPVTLLSDCRAVIELQDAPRLALVLIDADPAFLPGPSIAIALRLGHIGY